MKDYITYIPDLSLFRQSIDYDKVEMVCKTVPYYQGNRSVALVRTELTPDQNTFPGVQVIGEAVDSIITQDSDVNWYPGGLDTYLSVAPQTITYLEDGVEKSFTRPTILHSVLA